MSEVLHNTDIGLLPQSWRVSPIGSYLTKVQYGLSIKGGSEGRYPILRMTNQINGRISPTKLQFVNITADEMETFRMQHGDILFNRTNSFELVGRTSIFDLDGDYVFASYLIRLRADPTRLDPLFLNLYLNSAETQSRLKSIATRAIGQSNISAARLKGLAVPIPPLPEQRKIAGLLMAVRRTVGQQERLIAVTAELRRALLHRLFTGGFRHEPQKATDVGPVPESWEESKIGVIARIQSGGTPSRNVPENWRGGTIPWVKTGEVDYCIIKTTEEHITPVGLANSAARIFPTGTLLMAMYGQGITRGKVAILGVEAATNQACASIMPHDEATVSSRFLYYFLEYHYENLRKLGHGANQKNMNAALIRGFPVAFPKKNEQAEIVSALSALDAKQLLHKRKHAALTALFRTLLDQVMTAQIRVNNLDLSDLDPVALAAE